MPSRMRRSVALVGVLVAAAATSLGGQTARPAFDRKAVEIPHQKFVLAERPHAAGPHRPRGARRGREPLVHRRLAQRAAGQDRLRPPLRALLLQRLAAPSRRVPRGDGRPGRQQPQRHHQPGPHQLLRGRADLGARAHAVPRSRPPRVPGAADQPGDARARARRGAEREAAGREPAVRPRVQPHLRAHVSRRPSLQLARDRQHGGPERRLAAGREGLVRELLRAEQRGAVARRRHHRGARAGAREEVLRRHSRRSAGGTPRAVGAEARRADARPHVRPRAAGAHLSRVSRAGVARRRHRRACSCSPAC